MKKTESSVGVLWTPALEAWWLASAPTGRTSRAAPRYRLSYLGRYPVAPAEDAAPSSRLVRGQV